MEGRVLMDSKPPGSAVVETGFTDEMFSEVTGKIWGLGYPVFEDILLVVVFTVPPVAVEAELLAYIEELSDMAVFCEVADVVTEDDWTVAPVLELEESWVAEVLWDQVMGVTVEFCPDTRDGGRRSPSRSK